jgi:hypothetical protein
VWNIKTAVSRLSYAPNPKDMKVTNVKTGRFTFVPPPAKPVSYQELAKAIEKAGYGLEATAIEVRGTVGGDGRLRAGGTGQTFALAGPKRAELAAAVKAGAPVSVYGRWRSAPTGETIDVERWEAAK